MAKKDKPFQNTSAALASVWGTPTAGPRGVSVQKAASARRAGVTTDHHLTSMAQDLAAELEADRKAKEKAKDPRSNFEKKYNIRDRVAYVTPELFREILIDEVAFRRTKRNVDKLVIDDEYGLSATFEFKSSFEDEDQTHVTNCKDIFERGLAYTLTSANNYSRMILRRDSTSIGILEPQEVPVALSSHTEMMLKIDGQLHRTGDEAGPKESITYTGNLGVLFGKASRLDELVKNDVSGEVAITVSAHWRGQNSPFEIGTFSQPPEESLNKADFDILSCAALRKKDTVYYTHRDEAEFISDFFNRKSGYIVTFSGGYLGVLRARDVAPK